MGNSRNVRFPHLDFMVPCKLAAELGYKFVIHLDGLDRACLRGQQFRHVTPARADFEYHVIGPQGERFQNAALDSGIR